MIFKSNSESDFDDDNYDEGYEDSAEYEESVSVQQSEHDGSPGSKTERATKRSRKPSMITIQKMALSMS